MDIRDQTGYVWPGGLPIGQSWHDLFGLLGMLQFHQVNLCVEVGARHGGLAALLNTYMYYMHGRYLGFEIDKKFVDPRLRRKLSGGYSYGRLVIGDIFSAWCTELVQHEIARSRVALIYCDGGDKKREMHHLAPLLRPGDLLAAHDRGREIDWPDVSDLAGFAPVQAEYLQWADILALEKL